MGKAYRNGHSIATGLLFMTDTPQSACRQTGRGSALPPLAALRARDYTLGMNSATKTFGLALLAALALAACGPKDIGTGTSSDYAAAAPGMAPEEQLRYPMTGMSNTQRMLYHVNRPEVMSQMQQWQMSRFSRLSGDKPDPRDPAYRAVPKQRSPFRQ